jgi:hypothetical protein
MTGAPPDRQEPAAAGKPLDGVSERILKNAPKGCPRGRNPKAAPPKPETAAQPKRDAARKSAKAAPKPKAPKGPLERSWESVAAARASTLRESTRRIGPVQIHASWPPSASRRRATVSWRPPACLPARRSRRPRGGEASVKDMKSLRDLARKVNDWFFAGRWRTCELVALAERLEGLDVD